MIPMLLTGFARTAITPRSTLGMAERQSAEVLRSSELAEGNG